MKIQGIINEIDLKDIHDEIGSLPVEEQGQLMRNLDLDEQRMQELLQGLAEELFNHVIKTKRESLIVPPEEFYATGIRYIYDYARNNAEAFFLLCTTVTYYVDPEKLIDAR
jgi:hypothetical protein